MNESALEILPANSNPVWAAKAALNALAAAGVEVVFGNPGTTELPLIKALVGDDRIKYVLTLHEGTAVSAAAGYALGKGRPGVALLHAIPGVANGLGMYYNAFRSGLPLVVIGGAQDRRHQYRDPVLQADLVDMMRPVSKRVWEVKTAAEIGHVLIQALRDAATPPRGPVFISIPVDLLSELVSGPATRLDAHPPTLGCAPPNAVAVLVDKIVAASSPVFVAGDAVGANRSGPILASLTELAAATVYWSTSSSLANVPTTTGCYRGPIFASGEGFARALGGADLLVGFGAELMPSILFETAQLVPVGVHTAAVMESRNDRLGVLDPELSVCGDVALTLRETIRQLQSRLDRDPVLAARFAQRRDTVLAEGHASRIRLRERSAVPSGTTAPLAPRAAVAAILAAKPRVAIVVDEAVSNTGWLSLLGDFEDAVDYVALARGGALGLGLGTSIGVAIAARRPVLLVVGDGALMYGPQGLWTIAREHLPIVTCVLNNGGYEILRQFTRSPVFSGGPSPVGASKSLDIPPATLDLVGLARSCGLDSLRVTTAGQIGPAVARAFELGHPALIEVPVVRSES